MVDAATLAAQDFQTIESRALAFTAALPHRQP